MKKRDSNYRSGKNSNRSHAENSKSSRYKKEGSARDRNPKTFSEKPTERREARHPAAVRREGPLKEARYREFPSKEHPETQDELCWGRKPVLEMLETTPERCLKVSLSKNFHGSVAEKIAEICKESRIPFQRIDAVALDRLCDGENHQGVVAMTSPTPLLDLEDAVRLIPPQPTPILAIVLDHVQDPHNLGAIIRSAEAAGAAFVVIPKRRSALPMGTVVKTSAGASLRVPLVSVGNVAQAIERLQQAGLWSVGLDSDGNQNLFNGDLPDRLLLVVGAEGEGIGHATAKVCDELRRIPMMGRGASLNASVAAGLALFEWGRCLRK